MAGIAVSLGILASLAQADPPASQWPPFLPSRDGFSTELVTAIERTWTQRTLSRTLRGPSVHASRELYEALIDAPDVTAAAGRHRQYVRDDVRLIADDLYEADDKSGARGFYRVLFRSSDRRVIFSWGEHSGKLLGTIRGDALTVLTYESADGVIEQRVSAYVRIDNAILAALARALIVPFGRLADQKLGEGARLAARVAEWAATAPVEFCGWLERSDVAPERRAAVERAIPECQDSARALAPTFPLPIARSDRSSAR